MVVQDRITAVSTLLLMVGVYQNAKIINAAEALDLSGALQVSLRRLQREKHDGPEVDRGGK
jgi:hypothetical protein